MSAVAGPYAVACVVLVVAGVSKVRTPGPTAVALGGRGGQAGARVLGAVEVAAGLVGLVSGWWAAGLVVAALYLSFAVFAGVAASRGASSCGCFGAEDAPPGPVHVVLNVALAGASVAAGVSGVSVLDAVAETPFAGAPFVALVGVGAWLCVAAFTVLPEVARSFRPRVAR